MTDDTRTWVHTPCGGLLQPAGRGPCTRCGELPDHPDEVVELLPDTRFTGDPAAPAREPIRFTLAVQVEVSPDYWDLVYGTGTLPEAVRADVLAYVGAAIASTRGLSVRGPWRSSPPEPATPARRACCWKLPDGRHTLNCLHRCQDCGGDVDGPNRCRCRDDRRGGR